MVDIARQYPGQLAKPAIRSHAGLRRFVRRRSTIGFLMCLPLLVIVGGLIIYPALYSIYLAMLNKAQTRFVGLGNFSYLLSRDTFWMVIEQSAILTRAPSAKAPTWPSSKPSPRESCCFASK